MPHTQTSTKGLLFDMDGTLLDSTPAVEATWEEFSGKHGLDLSEVLSTTHGVRTIDNLRRLSGITDEAELLAAVDVFENSIASAAERLKQEGKNGLILLPGVDKLLGQLLKSPSPVWSVVTSATAIYANKALPTAGVAPPPFLITGDMCQSGKPHPEPYQRGAQTLGLDTQDCIVVEDAPSGIRSGVAAGCRVLAVCTSHKRESLEGLGAEWIVTDLSSVHASVEDGLIRLEILE